jgi:hypothetical protein
MQSAQDRFGRYLVTERKAVPAEFDWQFAQPRIGNAWSQGGMWSAQIVVGHPRLQDGFQVPFAQRNNPISSDGPTITAQSGWQTDPPSCKQMHVVDKIRNPDG